MPSDTWELRFTATRLSFPSWTASFPARLAIVTNRSGVWQAWAHDRTSGSWRQASDEPIGIETVFVGPDGRLVWFSDATGDETGRWIAQPFEGGEPAPLAAALPSGWPTGLALAPGVVAAGLEVEGEYRVYVVDGGDEPRLVYRSPSPCGVGSEWDPRTDALSPDGRLLCIRHTEHGDLLRPSLRIVDAETGGAVADLEDPGRRMEAIGWSPDGARFAFTNERGDRARPSIWDAGIGERRDLAVDLPGDVFAVDWFADGALLARHEFEGRAQLYRVDADSGATTLLIDPQGDIEGARVRPDGDVWLCTSNGATPARIVDASGAEVVRPLDPPAPTGHPLRAFWVENTHGDRIQSWVATPPGDGPFPLVFSVHGGPEWHERDMHDPETQAFVDAGYAVALPNYRGSTGYGVRFRESLIGNVCWTESEDLLAVLDALIAEGVADPDRVYWSGWSWGGCLACFNAGVNPDRWRAIFAGIPAGDFVAAHWASAPELQAWDDAVYQGSPNDVPEAYRRSDPMTYVDDVRAPVLVVAGEHDPRCPLEGITPWVDAVRARGGEVDVHLYPAGHHANAMADKVRHMGLVLDFFARHGGVG